ncbi:hypothetical protein SAMN05428961_110149 [Paenibacillus sp. OK060]|uniref:hypothetical protein n=1 Tax=Paenibacillus sp. OK060 TaxID=1881034 RepID=UPI00088EBFBA|nr:hypothetical protein [Paenibacillus sp. OK060]SDM17040.1 hypothetical protein SAMN05428961_110149 [Paenibacillus sp. OK060]
MTLFKQSKENDNATIPDKVVVRRPKTTIEKNMGLEKILKANDNVLNILKNR